MTIVVIIYFLLILSTVRIAKNNEEYLSKYYTNIIKGFFLLFVFIRHFLQYKYPLSSSWIDSIGVKFDSKIGQLIVTMFLFYSGYGIMESVKKKGENYINNIPKRRIFTTWVHFAMAVLIYMFASQYFMTHSFSIKKVVLALIGWESFGNSNWYIFCILILYFITYLSVKSFKDRKKILIAMTIGTLLYTITMSIYKQGYWYNTAFCYVLGSSYSLYKSEIEDFLNGRELICIVYLIAGFIITYNLKRNMLWYSVNTVLFALIVVIITRKLQLKNFILQWIGENLFPMYIFQRLPMMLLNKIEYMHNNPYIVFPLAFILTILITFIYNIIMLIINKAKEKVQQKSISKV